MSWADDAKREIVKQLKEIFPRRDVKEEWRSSAENKDWLKYGEVYAPYPDIAVGPFNIHTGDQAEQERREIENSFNRHTNFFQNIFEKNNHNQNPRCLLAIEIEYSGSEKHLVGDIINASILGYFGIIVVHDDLLSMATRIMKYLIGASEMNKIGDVARNVIVVEYSRFMERLPKAEKRKGEGELL